MSTDWILFALLALLWLATGGLPLRVLLRRGKPSPTGTIDLPPREQDDHAFAWRLLRRKATR